LPDGRPVDDQLKHDLTTDYKKANLSPEDILVLTFAEKINNAAYEIDRAYIDFLKGHGFSDRMIHDIVAVTAYFNYVNRMADALGVELEGE
jgi:alkylhydroperoxidase family enzyme